MQWVQGAGAPPPRAWLEVYKKIQRAGKLLQVTECPPVDLLLLCRELEAAVRRFYGKESS